MKKSTPWFWEVWKMPEREVWKLTPAAVDEYLEQAHQRKRS